MGGRPQKQIVYPEPPSATDFKGDTGGYDIAKRKWFADCMQLEGKHETYDDKAYHRTYKRAKRDRESDNRKRRERM